MLKPCAVVELVWQDGSGSTAVTAISVPSSSTVSEIDASATALASILQPLTDAVLIKQRIKYVSVPDEPSVASGGTPITRTGSFFFNTEDDNPIALIVVRAIKDSVIIDYGPGEGIIIDDTNSDVIGFIDAVVDSIVTNIFADDVTELQSAYLQSRV